MERLSNGGVMFHHWYMMDSRLWDTIRDRNLCGLSHAMALGHAHGAATCTLAGGVLQSCITRLTHVALTLERRASGFKLKTR